MGSLQVVHHPRRSYRHCSGHIFWRLANCSYHGIKNHQAETPGRILCRDRRCDHAVRNGPCWDSGQHHAYDHGSDYWSRGNPSSVRRPMGSGAPDCVGVGHHHSGVGGGCWSDFLGDTAGASHGLGKQIPSASFAEPFSAGQPGRLSPRGLFQVRLSGELTPPFDKIDTL